MASLRTNKAGKYIVCFRLLGKQFNRELGTENEKDAEAKRKRIEAITYEIEAGKLAIPEGCLDVGTFVVTDGQATGRPVLPKVATVQNVVDGFLAEVDGRVARRTRQLYATHLMPFAERYGSRPAESLTPAEAEAYVRKPAWSPTYRSGILGSLVSAYKWAERKHLIARNVLAGIRKPQKESRGASALISAEVHTKVRTR